MQLKIKGRERNLETWNNTRLLYFLWLDFKDDPLGLKFPFDVHVLLIDDSVG